VLVFHRRFGALLTVLAAGVGLDRVLVGVHYPVDVVAGALVGTAAALLATTAGRPYVTFAVRLASRVSDPVVAAVTRRIGTARRSLRG